MLRKILNQFRSALHIVDNGRSSQQGEKGGRVIPGSLAVPGVIQGDIDIAGQLAAQ